MISSPPFCNRLERFTKKSAPLILISLFWGFSAMADSPVPEAFSHSWSSVNIGGGGYVTGLVVHPAEAGLVYLRTDVGGAYRWDAGSGRWINLSLWLGPADANLYGVESIAVDPNNADIVYMACGRDQYKPPSESDILKSTDRGQTWTKLGFHKFNYGNGPKRWSDERLIVDPANSDVLYFGTRNDGLWRSLDSGTSWAQVTMFPTVGVVLEGLAFVEIDSNGGTTSGRSSVIYVGVHQDGIYRSGDGGETWARISGGPAYVGEVRQIEIAADGTKYFSFEAGDWSGGVWKLTAGDVWVNISPYAGMKFCALGLDPVDNSRLLVMTSWGFGTNEMWSSQNGGATWNRVIYNAVQSVPWRPPNFMASAPAALVIDPHDPKRVYFSDWYGVWRTDDITPGSDSSPVTFTDLSLGHEEVVAMALASGPSGAPLFSGVADVAGFRHSDVEVFPSSRFDNPFAEDTTSLAVCEDDPNFVVRAGGNKFSGTGVAAYSLDNGVSWTEFASYPFPGARNGRVALSKDGGVIVWIPEKINNDPLTSRPFYSTSRGASWQISSGAPVDIMNRGELWSWDQPLCADPAVNNRFYIYKGGSVYRSTDGGQSFSSVSSTLPSRGWWEDYQMKCSPDGNELWASFHDDGLYVSTDGGEGFSKLANVEQARLVAFGPPPSGGTWATVYLLGQVGGIYGMFLSLDKGATWHRINDDRVAFGNSPTIMEGDRQTFGTVYVGTIGLGIMVGKIAAVASGAPDLVPRAVTATKPSTATPTIFFDVEVENAGTVAISGTWFGFHIFVNGSYADWGGVTTDLVPGEKKVLRSQSGWTPTGSPFTAEARIDYTDALAESDESNNIRSFTVSYPSVAYGDWVASHLAPPALSNPSLADAEGDANQDGTINLVNYLTLTSPLTPAASANPAVIQSGGETLFTYRRLKGGTSDSPHLYQVGSYRYSVELCDSLSSGVWLSGEGLVEVANLVTDPSGLTQTVSLRALPPLSLGSTVFFRLRLQGAQ